MFFLATRCSTLLTASLSQNDRWCLPESSVCGRTWLACRSRQQRAERSQDLACLSAAFDRWQQALQPHGCDASSSLSSGSLGSRFGAREQRRRADLHFRQSRGALAQLRCAFAAWNLAVQAAVTSGRGSFAGSCSGFACLRRTFEVCMQHCQILPHARNLPKAPDAINAVHRGGLRHIGA